MGDNTAGMEATAIQHAHEILRRRLSKYQPLNSNAAARLTTGAAH